MRAVYVFWLLYILEMVNASVRPGIPVHLQACYSAGGPKLSAPRRLDVFLSLLRRLETDAKLDMKLFSTSLLRSLRLDGIEEAENTTETQFVLPYRASAFQFHRYQLLMDLFLPSQDLIDVDQSLSLVEKCLLHKMLSSSVIKWERGDENIVCPLLANSTGHNMNLGTKRVNSRCPVDEGVIQTDFGTISPGTLIATIAASLEPQRVPISEILNANIFKAEVAEPLMASAKQEWFTEIETLSNNNVIKTREESDISNVWAASLAGDLSEVVVNQGPRVGAATKLIVIGSDNIWNDTLFPRNLYLFPQNISVDNWHLTDAEMLAGIDGLILSQYISTWAQQQVFIKLSQIIEMYYSNEGISFDDKIRACNRQTLFTNMFNTSQLLLETSRFAHILSLRQGTVYIPAEEREKITQAAVSAFVSYMPTLFRKYHRDCQVGRNVPVVDLVIVTDGTWKSYAVQQFISWISGALELDLQHSSLGLLHGNTGQWVVPPADNLTRVLTCIDNFTGEWPNRLNLPNIVSTIIQYSQNKTLSEVTDKSSVGRSTVVLIVSPNDRPSATEVERTRDLMVTLRASYFDVYFAYVAQDLTGFQNVNNEYLDYWEYFMKTDSATVQDAISAIETYLIGSDIPLRMFGPQCPYNETTFEQVAYEDWASPGRKKSYRIHPFYMKLQALVKVQFQNSGQGQLLVCMWRGADNSHACQRINERENFTFNITAPCPSLEFCLPVNFEVAAINTSNTCAHDDCRLPNQVGYYIHHSGLRCLPLTGGSKFCSVSKALFIFFTFLMLF